jgi:cytochrome c553
MKKIALTVLAISIFSCQQKKEDSDKVKETKTDSLTTNTKKFDMYEMSEMALLMEQMYVENQRLKSKIIANDSLGGFPEHFKNIHTSVFTDPSEKDAFFEEQSVLFLEAQEKIYNDPKNAKTHFNAAVKVCIECHQVKCSGPIPKIKKLLIQ